MGERRGAPDITGLITLKVDNITPRTSADDLRAEFDKRDADEALAKMEGAEVDGQHLKIQYAMERRPDNPRRYYEQTRGAREREAYGGGGGGGGGGGYGGYRPRSRSPPRRPNNRSRSPAYRRRSRSPDRRRRSPDTRRSRSPRARRDSR